MDDPTSGTPTGHLKDTGRDWSMRSTESHSTLNTGICKWPKRLCKSHAFDTPSHTQEKPLVVVRGRSTMPQLRGSHWTFMCRSSIFLLISTSSKSAILFKIHLNKSINRCSEVSRCQFNTNLQAYPIYPNLFSQ